MWPCLGSSSPHPWCTCWRRRVVVCSELPGNRFCNDPITIGLVSEQWWSLMLSQLRRRRRRRRRRKDKKRKVVVSFGTPRWCKHMTASREAWLIWRVPSTEQSLCEPVSSCRVVRSTLCKMLCFVFVTKGSKIVYKPAKVEVLLLKVEYFPYHVHVQQEVLLFLLFRGKFFPKESTHVCQYQYF